MNLCRDLCLISKNQKGVVFEIGIHNARNGDAHDLRFTRTRDGKIKYLDSNIGLVKFAKDEDFQKWFCIQFNEL